MQTLKFVLTLLSLSVFLACATNKKSAVTNANYDETKNQTDYIVPSFGSVSLPSKWEKRHYNNVSQEQFFLNSDSIEVSVAFNRFDRYQFNLNGEFKGWDFVQAYCEWERGNQYNMASALLVQDMVRNFIIYKIFDTSDKPKIDSCFLVGEKDGNVIVLSISTTDKWTDKEKIKFLKAVYVK
jgi:hypothetical protein